MKSFKDHHIEQTIKEAIDYHVDNQIPVSQSIFRLYSDNFFRLFETVRVLYTEGVYHPVDDIEEEFLSTDIGQFGIYEGEEVPLDLPLMEKKEGDVELNTPKRGGPKKYYVYVKDGDKVKKVTWGDTTGLKVKINDPAARKSFAARHRCDQQNDKTSAAYWACRLPRYAKELGLKVDNPSAWW